MQRLDEAAIKQWCQGRGMRFSSPSAVTLDSTVGSLEVQFETASLQKFLGLLECLVPDWVDCPFAGGLIAVDTFAHWGLNDERVGRRVLDLLWSASQMPAESGRGVLFEADEHSDMQVGALAAVVAGWDAVLIPANGGYAAHLSHDAVVTICCRTEETLAEMNRRFHSLSLPTSASRQSEGSMKDS